MVFLAMSQLWHACTYAVKRNERIDRTVRKRYGDAMNVNQLKISRMQSSQARENIREILTRIEEHGEVFTITRHNRPCAVFMPVDLFDKAIAALTEAQHGATGNE